MYLVESISRIFPRIKPLFNFATFLLSHSPHVQRRWWSLGLGMIGMSDLSQFSPLFVDCLFNREIVGRFAVQKSLSCSAIRLCVCFADFDRIKYSIVYNLSLWRCFCFRTYYFFYLIQFRNRLHMYVVLRRNRLNRNLRWLSTMEYAISLEQEEDRRGKLVDWPAFETV